MTTTRAFAVLLTGASVLALNSYAQEPAAAPVDVASASEEVIVTGQIVYRNRVDTPAPVLTYGLDYFQRFEPLTVGDMLKRVPSAVFTSDVNEFDGLRLRGLDSAYSQILINGKKTPGAGNDRSFFVDRIPAELVEKIEIVRSSSADRPAEGIGGALNIVLKDAYSFEGVFMKAGLLHFDDGVAKGTGGVLWGGRVGDAAFTLGANIQGRHNPKSKVTDFFDGDDVFNDEREFESDVRDGTDYTLAGTLVAPVGDGTLSFSASYVNTDRNENEYVQIFEDDPLELDAIEAQNEDISQENWKADAELKLPWDAGTTEIAFGYARFDELTESTASEADPGDPLEAVELEIIDTADEELSATLAHTFQFGEAFDLKVGLDWLQKQRNASVQVFELPDMDEESSPRDRYDIEETRVDPYVKATWRATPDIIVEAGLRLETTSMDVVGSEGAASTDEEFLAPSLHVRWSITDHDRVYFSVARNQRRPDFDLIAPYVVEEEPADDDDFIGNPSLKPETSWGFDAGYERRLGKRGIVGVNVFYRKVEDVIELVSTGDTASGGGLVFTSGNVNDGEVWGVEMDLSMPLDFVGLPETGVFLNASLLDSSIIDPVTGEDRQFQNQPDWVFNAGFIQNLPTLDAAFGVTYRQQGEALLSVLGERRFTRYGGDLEVFVEKRFGETWALRLTASNLLDLTKAEDIYEYDGDSVEEITDNQINNVIDEIEREREKVGPVVQLVLRAAF